MRDINAKVSEDLWLREPVGAFPGQSPSNGSQLSRSRAALETALMGGVTLAALGARLPGVSQGARDGILGGLLTVAGLYALTVVWRGRPPAALRWILIWYVALIAVYLGSFFYSPNQNIAALRP